MILSPNTLTTSSRFYHHSVPSYSTNNDIATLHPVISDLRMRQKNICEYCGRIRHKANTCIICGHKFLPSSLRRNINKLKALHGDKLTDLTREWNSQPPAAHFKSSTYPPKTSPVVSAIIGKLNYCAVDNS